MLAGGQYRFQNSKERFSKVCLLKSFPLIASPKNLLSQIFGSRFLRMPDTFEVIRFSFVPPTVRGRFLDSIEEPKKSFTPYVSLKVFQ